MEALGGVQPGDRVLRVPRKGMERAGKEEAQLVMVHKVSERTVSVLRVPGKPERGMEVYFISNGRNVDGRGRMRLVVQEAWKEIQRREAVWDQLHEFGFPWNAEADTLPVDTLEEVLGVLSRVRSSTESASISTI